MTLFCLPQFLVSTDKKSKNHSLSDQNLSLKLVLLIPDFIFFNENILSSLGHKSSISTRTDGAVAIIKIIISPCIAILICR